MNEHRCPECRRTFYTDAELNTHQWLRHGDQRDWNKKLRYPPPTCRAGAGEFEAAWFGLQMKRLLLEDQSMEYQEKAEVIREELMRLGSLDYYGRGKAKPKPPVTKKAAKKATAGGGSGGSHFSDGRPPQPAGKPYWDSKHGRWTDNVAYAPKTDAGKKTAKAARKPVTSSGRDHLAEVEENNKDDAGGD